MVDFPRGRGEPVVLRKNLIQSLGLTHIIELDGEALELEDRLSGTIRQSESENFQQRRSSPNGSIDSRDSRIAFDSSEDVEKIR